ncbi:MAG: branched-chain amino acid ABC transporter permease [Desulfobacterales bacterium]
MSELLQYLFSGVTNGAIYAVIALGFCILYNATELINFAHGEFVMLGGLALVTFWQRMGLPLPVAFVCSVGAGAVAGFLFERLAIRTVKKPEPIVLVIVTVGASILLRGAGMLIWGKDAYSVPPFTATPPIELAGATITAQSLWILGIVLAVSFALQGFFRKTLTGRAMEACAISRKAAWLAGIPTGTMVLLSFIMSTGIGAMAGVIIAPITMCSYDMGTMLGLKGFCAAMLGGLGSLWGGVVGGFLLGILEAAGIGLVSSGFKDATAFLLLLLILYFRPSGLLGKRAIKRF